MCSFDGNVERANEGNCNALQLNSSSTQSRAYAEIQPIALLVPRSRVDFVAPFHCFMLPTNPATSAGFITLCKYLHHPFQIPQLSSIEVLLATRETGNTLRHGRRSLPLCCLKMSGRCKHSLIPGVNCLYGVNYDNKRQSRESPD